MLFDRLQLARRAVVRHALAAERAGFDAHEQALTEVLLTRAAPAVRVWTFSQRDEAKTGADWLWWLEGDGEWFGVLVQAKRHKPVEDRPFYDVAYRSGSGPLQIDQLLAAARWFHVPAAYVLYNHPAFSRSVAVGSPCCSRTSDSWRTRLRVAVLPALAAKSLVGTESSAPQYCRPIECLACGRQKPRLLKPVRSSMTDLALLAFLREKSPNQARAAARGIVGQLTLMRSGHFKTASRVESWTTQPDHVGARPYDIASRVFTALPGDTGHFDEPYFEHVLRGLRSDPPAYVAALLEGDPIEEIESELEGIDGLVVIKDPRR